MNEKKTVWEWINAFGDDESSYYYEPYYWEAFDLLFSYETDVYPYKDYPDGEYTLEELVGLARDVRDKLAYELSMDEDDEEDKEYIQEKIDAFDIVDRQLDEIIDMVESRKTE